MIATRRGLAVLAAIALLVGALLALDLAGGAPARETRALLPGLDADAITALRWTGPAAELERGSDGWRAGPAVAADPAAVDQVLSALRGARWHRRTAASAAPTRTLAIGPRVLGLGADLPGGEQTWLVRADDALLVDAWVARALFPAPLALRVRAPFADARTVVLRDGAGSVEIDLLRGALVHPTPLALAPERTAALAAALGGLVIARLADAPVAATARLTVIAAGQTGELAGPCPDAPELVALRATTGDGCVPAAAAAALAAEAALLAGPATAIADPRPVAAPPLRVTLRDGGLLDLAKRPQLVVGAVAVDVDPTRLAALRAALVAPGAVVALPAEAPVGSLVVTPIAGAPLTLDLYGEAMVARRGEPVALRLPPATYAALAAPASALRDPALWVLEPTAIAAITLAGHRTARGAVLGEWTGGDPAQLETLAAALAAPRAATDVPAPGRALRHGELELRSAAGAPEQRAFDLEAIGARCALRVDGRAAWIDPRACAR